MTNALAKRAQASGAILSQRPWAYFDRKNVRIRTIFEVRNEIDCGDDRCDRRAAWRRATRALRAIPDVETHLVMSAGENHY